MRSLLSAVLLMCFVGLISSTGLSESFVSHLWNKFKKSHGKTYLSEEHESFRQEIFSKNLHLIEKHNSEFSMGMVCYLNFYQFTMKLFFNISYFPFI